MRMKRPHLASMDEVRISRDGESAVIEFVDANTSTTHLKVGPEIEHMTDHELLDLSNDCIRAQQKVRAQYEHVAVEIPPGQPQIEYFHQWYQWTPRGDVLRCVISEGGPENEPIIYIDDRELSWKEFGHLLTTYAGWGMRVCSYPTMSCRKNRRSRPERPRRSGRGEERLPPSVRSRHPRAAWSRNGPGGGGQPPAPLLIKMGN